MRGGAETQLFVCLHSAYYVSALPFLLTSAIFMAFYRSFGMCKGFRFWCTCELSVCIFFGLFNSDFVSFYAAVAGDPVYCHIFAASLNCLNSYWLEPPAVFPAAHHAQVIQTKLNSWCHSSHRASQRSLKSVNNCCCFCVIYLCTFAQGAAV